MELMAGRMDGWVRIVVPAPPPMQKEGSVPIPMEQKRDKISVSFPKAANPIARFFPKYASEKEDFSFLVFPVVFDDY